MASHHRIPKADILDQKIKETEDRLLAAQGQNGKNAKVSLTCSNCHAVDSHRKSTCPNEPCTRVADCKHTKPNLQHKGEANLAKLKAQKEQRTKIDAVRGDCFG